MNRKLIISLLLFGLMLVPGLLGAQQIRVSPDGDVRSIKSAIEMAEPGDHIIVDSGTYVESEIVINKPLTLEGINRPVIDGNAIGNILVIRADSVTIKGFMIKNTGRSYVRDYSAILIENSKDFLIEDNELDNVYFGIYLAETDGGVVKENKIQSYDIREAASGNGIHLWSVRSPKIINNSIKGLRDGIYLEFAKEAEITGNRSNDNNRYGLHFMFSDDSIYRKNIFRRNGAGVAVMYSTNVDMSENLFEHNWGAAAYGLLLKDITHSRIENNRFYRNTIGFFSESSSNIEIHSNNFELNGYAVNIKSSSRANRFSENNFIENSFDVTTDSPRNPNTFDSNYWSHYEGYDLGQDGIGDVPYRPVRLFSVITQRQSESLILLRSMLITLLDTAERIMPVLTPQTLTDERPKMERLR